MNQNLVAQRQENPNSHSSFFAWDGCVIVHYSIRGFYGVDDGNRERWEASSTSLNNDIFLTVRAEKRATRIKRNPG